MTNSKRNTVPRVQFPRAGWRVGWPATKGFRGTKKRIAHLSFSKDLRLPFTADLINLLSIYFLSTFGFPSYAARAHSVFHVTSTQQVGGNSLKNPFDIRTKCNAIPGLTREQVQLCYQATDVTLIALDGLDLAIHECQSQVRRAEKRGGECATQRINCPMLFSPLVSLRIVVSSVPLELLVA